MPNSNTLVVPVIRARIGDWWFYVATLTFEEVAERVKRVSEIHEKKELKTWIQREIKDERLAEIADYIQNQPQRFFNGLVLGMYDGDPDWMPVKVSRNLARPQVVLTERVETAFGLIRLTGNEQIFAIDGQHRVEGIKRALATDESGALAQDEQTVLFVAHKETDAGRERTRRLFATLNKYAKPVSKGEIIALSEDDAFAIVTRLLVDSYRGLSSEFVPLLKTANLPPSDQRSLTSLITLYEVVRAITLPTKSRERKRLEVGPPHPERVQDLLQTSIRFWDALKSQFPEIHEVCLSAPDAEIAGRFRHSNGGHLMFRPIGLTAAAKAARVLLDRGFEIDEAVEMLTASTMDLSADPWKHVIWDPNRRIVITKNAQLIKNLLLVNAGALPDPESFDVAEEYRKAIGEAQSTFVVPEQHN